MKCLLLFCLLVMSGCAGSNGNAPLLKTTVSAAGAVADVIEKNHTSYSTKFSVKDKGRLNNLTLASDAINGTVIQPDEIFSYNDTIGPTTKKRGYKLARIFVKGKDSKGYGGGVCQVSSTLYNAAEEFGLEIIERHPHSKDVGYVPKGRDAATSYGKLDLKFKNTMNFPVKILSAVDNNTITVEVVKV